MSSSESGMDAGSGNAIDDPAADALGTHPAGALQTIAAAGMPAAASIRSAATSPSSAAAVAHIAAAASIPPAAISPRSAAAVTTEILKFEISVVNDLIERRRWSDLETYLCKCVALLLVTKREDIPSLHPGLVMIPREQHFFELLAAKPQESLAFFKELIEPLKDSESKFKPLKLGSRIDLLGKGKRLIPVEEVEIQSVLSDYLQLYFPSFVEGNAEKPQGFWQFARKLTETQVDAKKPRARAHYRCLACQWVVPGAHSISKLQNHLLHTGDCIACPNVTPDILERIKDYEKESGLKDAKRKSSSLSAADGSTASSSASSNTYASYSKKKTKFGADMVVDANAVWARIEVLQSFCSRVAWLIQDFDAPWRGNAVKLLMEQKRLLVQLESVFLGREGSHATGPFLDEKDPVLAKMDSIASLCSSTFTMVYPPTAAPAHQSFIEALINFEDDLYELRSIYRRSEYRFTSREPSVASTTTNDSKSHQ